MTEIAGVHGPAYGEILALPTDPDWRAIKADATGGLVGYGEIPGTFPATLLGDKTISCRVQVPASGYVKFWEVANLRLGMIPSGSGWKPYAYVISPTGDQTVTGTELAVGSGDHTLYATYEKATGTLTLIVDDSSDGDVSFGEARDTLAGLPIWQAGAAPGGWVTDCGLWDEVLDFAFPLTVTINQGSGQADPSTTGWSIVFDVVFSEAVTGFATGDVTFSGTAGGTLVGTVTGSGAAYTVTVTGMTTAGTVIASIASSVCTSVSSGTPNDASTSTDNTVTWAIPTPPVAGYYVWFDAADTSTITHSSGVVSGWADKSGSSRNLSVVAASSGPTSTGPTTNSRTQNGRNVLDFNGTSDMLGRSAFWHGAMSTSTMFVVFMVDADPSDDNLGTLVYEAINGAANPEFGLRYGTQYANGVWVTNGGTVKANITDTGVDITTGPTPHFATQTFSGTAMTLSIDAGAGASVTGMTAGTTTPGVFAVGRGMNFGGPRGHNGWIAEVLIYPSVLSGSDIDLVEAYLIAKWGL